MATVVITENEGDGWVTGYIDYRVSHRYFRLCPDGTINGRIGRITDADELALIREALPS